MPIGVVSGHDGWPLAMLSFSPAARKLAPRDRFIGWTPQLREKNLPLVVDKPLLVVPDDKGGVHSIRAIDHARACAGIEHPLLGHRYYVYGTVIRFDAGA